MLTEQGHDFNATFIVGGQVVGEEPRLFHIYSAGNFIESSSDTPYFQIGESKHGKPIIRRDEFRLATHISIDLEDEYFTMIRTRWGLALQEVFSQLPNPNW